MILFKEAASLSTYLSDLVKNGETIGFVPTMGALHKGHLSLIEKSKTNCSITVCSIFVNPTQFNDAADFEKYPKTLSEDIYLLERANCDVLFLPPLQEIYPAGTASFKPIDLGEIEHLLEGKYRPGHFQGVCQVVERLLHIVQPTTLLLGQKDYQQCLVIKTLINQQNIPVHVLTVPTFREEDGLALSSRNLRLTGQQKHQAASIYAVLQHIKAQYQHTPLNQLRQFATNYLLENGFEKIDYVEVADSETLLPIQKVNDNTKAIALVAAFIGGVRLIDNLVLND